jgi:hypothetical protein
MGQRTIVVGTDNKIRNIAIDGAPAPGTGGYINWLGGDLTGTSDGRFVGWSFILDGPVWLMYYQDGTAKP